jgi:molybdenum cofactor cytidylyltransferase
VTRSSARVAAILLAAGESSRMGLNKLLLELDGESLLRRCARQTLAAGLDSVTVVLGFEADRVAGELDGLDCRSVINREYARGQHGSVKSGLAELPAEVDAALIVLADMHRVTTEAIDHVVGLYRRSSAPLVVSCYGDVVAPPTLYDRALFSELLDLDDGAATREVIGRHRARAVVARWPAAALADLDTPEDYERARGEQRKES